MGKRRLVLVVLSVWVVAMLAGCAGTPTPGMETRPAAGFMAPDFMATRIDGERHRLSDLRGKIVVINFWATWCFPCEAEMPLLESLHKEYSDRVVIMAISQGETKDMVDKFQERFDYTMPMYLDESLAIGKAYKAAAIPLSLVIDEKGMVVLRHQGIFQGPEIRELLAVLTAED